MSNQQVRFICDQCGKEITRTNELAIYRGAHVLKFKKYPKEDVVTCRPGHLYLQKGRVVHLDVFFHFGDYFCYWVDSDHTSDVHTCSRKCAIAYASANREMLIRLCDGGMVVPNQAQFDAYAVDHHLEHPIALMEEDGWLTPVDEMKSRLRTEPQYADRIAVLAGRVLQLGYRTLVQNALDRLKGLQFRIEYVSALIMLSSLLEKTNELDEYFDAKFRIYGSYENVGAFILSSWAMMVSKTKPAKALKLSQIAVHQEPTHRDIIGNHLLVLISSTNSDGQLKFLESNAHLLQSHEGYYTAGVICKSAGRYDDALAYAELAYQYDDDPSTESLISGILFDLGRFEEALIHADSALRKSEVMEDHSIQQPDGAQTLVLGAGYEEKQFMRSNILIQQGKILCELGEVESGQQRIRDALDIRSSYGGKPGNEYIEPYLKNYISRDELEQEALEQRKLIATINNTLERKRIDIQRLSDILEAIASIQQQWNNALLSIRSTALSDIIDQNFADHLHTFSVLLRNAHADNYETIRIRISQRYGFLSAKVIEQISNAWFLMDELSNIVGNAPVFAGAVIEWSKAIESALNEVLVTPFANHILELGLDTFKVKVRSVSGGQPLVIRIISEGRVMHLMLNDLVSFITCGDTEWLRFLGKKCLASDCDWLRDSLSHCIKEIKDTYRNGCAHADSANRAHAKAMSEYIEKMAIFQRLNEIARTLK